MGVERGGVVDALTERRDEIFPGISSWLDEHNVPNRVDSYF